MRNSPYTDQGFWALSGIIDTEVLLERGETGPIGPERYYSIRASILALNCSLVQGDWR